MTSKEKQLQAIKKQVKQGEHEGVFQSLVNLASSMDDLTLQHGYTRILKSLDLSKEELKPLRIALVGSSTLDHFSEILRFWLASCGFQTEIWDAGYNMIEQNILNPDSELYQFNPDIVWIFTNHRDVQALAKPGDDDKAVSEAQNLSLQRFQTLWKGIQEHCSATIIQNNADIPPENTFGNFESSTPWGKTQFLQNFNHALAQITPPGVVILDFDSIANYYGKSRWLDERYWYHSKHAFSLNANGLVAARGARLIQGLKGQAKKCLVLDLDNTLWGGVIGDDGLEGILLGHGAEGEAFVDFQRYLLSLKERGIILTVCSKNEDENARLPFLKHPDMVLKIEDIAVFVANWQGKSDNIQNIAKTLDIGLDSMVFLDDNPAERDLVRQMLPMVSVPEMPEDPSFYLRTLDEQRYFETTAFSEEDSKRAEMYRNNAQRKSIQNQYSDLSEYLKSLEMKATVGDLDPIHLPRFSQLINKSNQFHLTTTRYTESEITQLLQDERYSCHYFKLKDKFGDNGLISAVILKKEEDGSLQIDTWAMSCRVLARQMEDCICNTIADIAQRKSCQKVKGIYIPSKKNKLVKDLYKKMGFQLLDASEEQSTWEIHLDSGLKERTHHIELEHVSSD